MPEPQPLNPEADLVLYVTDFKTSLHLDHWVHPQIQPFHTLEQLLQHRDL